MDRQRISSVMSRKGSVLQRVAVCCSVLQCVVTTHIIINDLNEQCAAVSCSELQCVAVCCSELQCVAVSCSELQ